MSQEFKAKSIVGTNVRKYRMELSLSSIEFSKLLGWQTSDHINKIESGESGMSIVTLGKLADELGVSMSDLTEEWGNEEWELNLA